MMPDNDFDRGEDAYDDFNFEAALEAYAAAIARNPTGERSYLRRGQMYLG